MWITFYCFVIIWMINRSTSITLAHVSYDFWLPLINWNEPKRKCLLQPMKNIMKIDAIPETQTNKGGVAAWADVPKGTLGNLTPADRHGSVQVRSSLICQCFLLSPSLFLYLLFDVLFIDIATPTHTTRHTLIDTPIWIFISKASMSLCKVASLVIFARWQAFELFPSSTTVKSDWKIISR